MFLSHSECNRPTSPDGTITEAKGKSSLGHHEVGDFKKNAKSLNDRDDGLHSMECGIGRCRLPQCFQRYIFGVGCMHVLCISDSIVIVFFHTFPGLPTLSFSSAYLLSSSPCSKASPPVMSTRSLQLLKRGLKYRLVFPV